MEINVYELGLNNTTNDSNLTTYWGNTNAFPSQHIFFEKLSEEEKNRANKFVFEKDKNTYVISHGLLINLLQTTMKIEPKLAFFEKKKPYLLNGDIDFNISHSDYCFAIAIGDEKKLHVGIDIEHIKPSLDYKGIIDNYMHVEEVNYINSGNSESICLSRFYEIWTQKEALLKMIGIGIVAGLPSVNVLERHKKITIESTGYNIPAGIKNAYLQTFHLDKAILSVSLSEQRNITLKELDEEEFLFKVSSM